MIETTTAERIKLVRKDINLTQREFAERIGVKQNTIATYETGATVPSERTLNDICREFKVNMEWLKFGAGEMHRQTSRSEEIAKYVAEILTDEDAEFQRRIISAMSQIPAGAWPGIAKFVQALVDAPENTPDE